MNIISRFLTRTQHRQQEDNQPRENLWTRLPNEVCIWIFSKLQLKEWNALSQTNKYFQVICKNQQVIDSIGKKESNLSSKRALKIAKLLGHSFEFLSLRNTFLTHQQLEELIKFSPNIKEIYLEKVKISSIGLEYLTNLPSLKFLTLYACNNVTNVEFERIKALTSLHSLKLIWCNHIKDFSLEHLTALISLRCLTLMCQKITDVGLAHLAELTTRLRYLNLSDCDQITDFGLAHLTKLTCLQYLNLDSCTYITDVGLERLTVLTSLQLVEIWGCHRTTYDGRNHLRKYFRIKPKQNYYKISDSNLDHLKKFTCLHNLNLIS